MLLCLLKCLCVYWTGGRRVCVSGCCTYSRTLGGVVTVAQCVTSRSGHVICFLNAVTWGNSLALHGCHMTRIYHEIPLFSYFMWPWWLILTITCSSSVGVHVTVVAHPYKSALLPAVEVSHWAFAVKSLKEKVYIESSDWFVRKALGASVSYCVQLQVHSHCFCYLENNPLQKSRVTHN